MRPGRQDAQVAACPGLRRRWEAARPGLRGRWVAEALGSGASQAEKALGSDVLRTAGGGRWGAARLGGRPVLMTVQPGWRRRRIGGVPRVAKALGSARPGLQRRRSLRGDAPYVPPPPRSSRLRESPVYEPLRPPPRLCGGFRLVCRVRVACFSHPSCAHGSRRVSGRGVGAISSSADGALVVSCPKRRFLAKNAMVYAGLRLVGVLADTFPQVAIVRGPTASPEVA